MSRLHFPSSLVLVIFFNISFVGALRISEKHQSVGAASGNLTAQTSFASSTDQLGRRTTLSCVSPLSPKLVNLGTTGDDLSDREQLRSFMFAHNDKLLLRIAHSMGGTIRSALRAEDVPRKARKAAKKQLIDSLKLVANIKSLPALEEFYKIVAGFGIIRRSYESVREQIWARELVDCSLALYDGSDFVDYFKPPEEIQDEENGFKWKTKFKYGRQVFGIANHFFNIYIMTWLPNMEGIIHSHGESACSFKFLTEATGFVQQGFHDVALAKPKCPVKSFAFKDWQKSPHFGMTCDDAVKRTPARLNSLKMKTIPSSGNAKRGQVFYIQDDLGVHRFDNKHSKPGFTVNVYYPSYEKTWLFSYFNEEEILVHTTQGTLKSMTAVSEWLDKHGRDAPLKQMAIWRLPKVFTGNPLEIELEDSDSGCNVGESGQCGPPRKEDEGKREQKQIYPKL